MKQTKIVASISDRRCDADFIRKLFYAGMNVVRMNTAHASVEGIREIVRNTRSVSHHIGILIDTKGPEIRTTGCESPITYKVGDVVKIFGRPEMDSEHDIVNVTYVNFANDVKEGNHILFDDGALDMLVIGINGPAVIAQVQNDGVLGSRKSVNVPGVHIDLPSLTEKDVKFINLAIDEDIDFIAHSFVRNAADVKAVQRNYRLSVVFAHFLCKSLAFVAFGIFTVENYRKGLVDIIQLVYNPLLRFLVFLSRYIRNTSVGGYYKPYG